MVEIIVALITLAGTIVGGGIIFYKQNKKLKEMDVKYRNAEAKGLEAQTNGQVVNNENSAAEFWKKSSISLQDEVNDLRQQIKLKDNSIMEYVKYNRRLNDMIHDYEVMDTQKSSAIAYLEWCRCEINDCFRREPPRDYQKTIDNANKIRDELTSDLDAKRQELHQFIQTSDSIRNDDNIGDDETDSNKEDNTDYK